LPCDDDLVAVGIFAVAYELHLSQLEQGVKNLLASNS
jgi:hypothetical protein